MERYDIEHINNIVKIAASKGTSDEPIIEGGIDNLINVGVAQIQSKMIMLEAFKIELINNDELIERVAERYDTLCEKLGYK